MDDERSLPGKRICDQDLIDQMVEPPTTADLTQSMKHTLVNLNAYFQRSAVAGEILTHAQATGECIDEAKRLFQEAMTDLVQTRATMDDLLRECFDTYRQRSDSKIIVVRDRGNEGMN